MSRTELHALSETELKMLIDDLVREEALHREAWALGMDVNDYVIKQRMIQSLYLIGASDVIVYIDDADGGADTPGYTEPGMYKFHNGRCTRIEDACPICMKPARATT